MTLCSYGNDTKYNVFVDSRGSLSDLYFYQYYCNKISVSVKR